MKVSNLLLGLGGLIPATVLLFSAREFNLIQPDAGFGQSLQTALILSVIAAWSCYIVSLAPIMRAKEVPTSMEGMITSGQVSLSFGIGYAALHLLVVREFSWMVMALVLLGTVSAGLMQGFYIGFSKARLNGDDAKAFIFRLIGLGMSGLLLAVYLFLAYQHESAWTLSAGITVMLGTVSMLSLMYLRASRQRKRYLSRRYKPRSTFAFEDAQPMVANSVA